jgi:hypothetical protein
VFFTFEHYKVLFFDNFFNSLFKNQTTNYCTSSSHWRAPLAITFLTVTAASAKKPADESATCASSRGAGNHHKARVVWNGTTHTLDMSHWRWSGSSCCCKRVRWSESNERNKFLTPSKLDGPVNLGWTERMNWWSASRVLRPAKMAKIMSFRLLVISCSWNWNLLLDTMWSIF